MHPTPRSTDDRARARSRVGPPGTFASARNPRGTGVNSPRATTHASRSTGPLLLLLAACTSTPKSAAPAAITPEPARYDLARAAHYLDTRALDWLENTPEIGENFKCALSCHTTAPYLSVRATLPSPASPTLTEVRNRIEARVNDNHDWSSATPFYGKPGSKLETPSRATEAIMNATALALQDKSAGREASATTLRALDHMLGTQNADGSFPWLSFDLEPWESSPDFGAAAAALAFPLGASTDAYRRAHRPEFDRLAKHLRARLADETRPMSVHDQAILLWATRRSPDLLDTITRTQIADRLRTLQQHDGGWSLATWGRGKLATTESTAPSDGYATALATIALAEGESTSANGVRKGLDWLAAHQRADGTWPAHSINKDADPNNRFMVDAATAYAAFALANYR